MSLKFATRSGLFQGKITDPASGAPLRFSGVVLQGQNAGYGLVEGWDLSSRVQILP